MPDAVGPTTTTNCRSLVVVAILSLSLIHILYGKPFTMREYGKLMFNCNELPKEVEQTNAFFRRFLIIPFNQTIPESEQDPELAKKIIASELSGVFNWLLDGLRRLLSQKKFTQSEIVRNQIEAYRRESDSVAMFMDCLLYTSRCV